LVINITLISNTPLRYVRDVAREEYKCVEIGGISCAARAILALLYDDPNDNQVVYSSL